MARRTVEFYRHNLSDEDKAAVCKVMDSIFLSTGQVTGEFEKKFAGYLGRKHAVGVTSATAALELALHHSGVAGPEDEVVTTAMSFLASANVIEVVGGTTVFVDCERDTANIDVALVAKALNERTKAVLVVHMYGQMSDMRELRRVVDAHNTACNRHVTIIEDCAHCIEGQRDGIRVGELGEYCCFSFYATKNITCGEGGAIATDSSEIAEWMYLARAHGMSRDAAQRYKLQKFAHYDMHFVGWKCNMNDIQAAMLMNQVDHIDQYLERKTCIAQRYTTGLQPLIQEGLLELPAVRPDLRHAWHIFTMWVFGPGGVATEEYRSEVIGQIRERGVGCTVNYRPIPALTFYRNKYNISPSMFPNADRIGNATITIPLYPLLSDDDVDYVVEAVSAAVRAAFAIASKPDKPDDGEQHRES